MNMKCETVIFSDKAYNAIIRESFDKHPVETGGILLGYILPSGIWVVMEVLPPGEKGIFETAYFEYDQDFVNYLANSVANQYKMPLQLLGLWHRHPGSMDYFSSTDDGTNADFASRNPYGVISGLVNIDPNFRLTMYHLDHSKGPGPRQIAYSTVNVEVGDDIIPESYFELRYVDPNNRQLNPTPTGESLRMSQHNGVPSVPRNNSGQEHFDAQTTPPSTPGVTRPPAYNPRPTNLQTQESLYSERKKKPGWLLPLICVIVFLFGVGAGICATSLFSSDKKKPKAELIVSEKPVDKVIKSNNHSKSNKYRINSDDSDIDDKSERSDLSDDLDSSDILDSSDDPEIPNPPTSTTSPDHD